MVVRMVRDVLNQDLYSRGFMELAGINPHAVVFRKGTTMRAASPRKHQYIEGYVAVEESASASGYLYVPEEAVEVVLGGDDG